MRPTVREIAAVCGCSPASVSFVLSNHPRASVQMRERVMAVAKNLGWTPNPLASAYMAHFRSTKAPHFKASLGFLNTNPVSNEIQDLPEYQQRYFNGARARAEELGYSLQSVWLHEPGLTSRRLVSILRSRGIPGLVVPSIIRQTPIFDSFDWSGFASATGGYTLKHPALHRVSGHFIHGTHLLLRKAFEMEFQKIAVIFSANMDDRIDHGILYPILLEQKQRRGHEWIKYNSPRLPLTDTIRRNLEKWITAEMPDVIIGERWVRDILRGMNWNVPSDVAFIATDWSPGLPHICGLNQLHEVRGAATVDLVSAQLLQNERGIPIIPKLLLVEGQWQDGTSASAVPVQKRAAGASLVA